MTTPATEAERRGLQALGQAMDELMQACQQGGYRGTSTALRRTHHALLQALGQTEQSPGNEYTVWSRTMHVLNLMHSLDDQAHKRVGKDYRDVTRRGSEDGRTQAALTLVRGIAHHHGSEVQALVWYRLATFTARGGEFVQATGQIAREGEYVPIDVSIASGTWRPLAELPSTTEKTYDRDTYYAQHVEGRTLMEPLVAAQRFLAGLQQE